MSSRTLRRQLPLAGLVRGGGATLAAAALAACGAAPAPVDLPAKSPAAIPASSAPGSAGSDQQQAAADAYLAFWSASSQAEKAGNAAKAQAILAPYVYPAYITTMISGMRSAWSRNEVVSGSAVEHLESVSVVPLKNGEYAAIVRDCQDSSHQGFANARTHTLVAGSLGAPHQELYTSMGLVSGRWLVEQVTFVGDTCTS